VFARKNVLGITATLPMPGSSSSKNENKKTAAPHPPLIRNALRSMLIIGGGALAANTLAYAYLFHPSKAPLWPVLVSAIAFLFLWRLSALIFDLVFIWHRYIRFSGALTFLRRSILPASASKEPGASGGKP
jgi:hypothetical protein